MAALREDYRVSHSPAYDIVIVRGWPTPPGWQPETAEIRLEFHSDPPVVLVSDELEPDSREDHPSVFEARNLSNWKEYHVGRILESGDTPRTLVKKLREDLASLIHDTSIPADAL